MKKKLALGIIALLMGAGSSYALTSQEVIDSLAAEGYTRVEVKNGLSQMKVEAIRGTEKLEVVYDSATGAILKSETEAVGPGDDTAPGFEISNRGRDFVDSDDLEDDDDSIDDDDEDDDDDRGRGRGRGRGGDDDDHDDDHGGDDHGDDDHGGRGRGGDDD